MYYHGTSKDSAKAIVGTQKCSQVKEIIIG